VCVTCACYLCSYLCMLPKCYLCSYLCMLPRCVCVTCAVTCACYLNSSKLPKIVNNKSARTCPNLSKRNLGPGNFSVFSRKVSGFSRRKAILGGLFQRFRGRDSGSRELEVGGIGDSQFAAQHGWALGSTSANHANMAGRLAALAPTMH